MKPAYAVVSIFSREGVCVWFSVWEEKAIAHLSDVGPYVDGNTYYISNSICEKRWSGLVYASHQVENQF